MQNHSKLYFLLSLSFFFFFPAIERSQNADFSPADLFRALQSGINDYRKEHGVDTLETNNILENAAKKSAAQMAKIQKADPNAGGKTPGEKLKKEGGTLKADEVEFAFVAAKGKKSISVKEISQTIMAKWKTEKRMKVALLQPNWVFCGFGEMSDKDNKKHYVSCMLGGYESFNDGAKKKSELKVKYNNKSKKLKGPDAKTCKNCSAWKDFEKLHKGLKVEKGKIYIEYDNLKYLKKLIKKPTDGLGVDIIQFEQYKHPGYNIVDNNQKNKGVMQKVIYRDKLFEKNQIKPDPKAKKKVKINKIKVEIGKLPSGISGSYELNLMVVQDNKICKTVLQSYLEEGIQKSNTPLTMLAPPEGISARALPFEPKGETSLLNFIVPFEKNKSEFKPEDIKPLIDALNEPDFHIDGLYIYAYSSIEGDSTANDALQHRRAESITKILHKINQTSVTPMIVTNDSWLLFQMEAEDGKFDYLSKMNKRQAIKEINKNSSLLEELEPILAKERFAQIVMDVTYDISGNKEEKFAFMKFNQAVKQENYKLAFRILNFIFYNLQNGKYSPETWSKLEIPLTKKNTPILVMRNYFDYLMNDTLPNEEIQKELKKITEFDPENAYASYNSIFCSVKLDSTVGDENYQSQFQNQINALYKTPIAKKETDALNAEWNFKIIDHYDTIEGMEGKIESCISRIKSFYNFKESNWENSLKLAYVFTNAGEYEFAASILEPHLTSAEASENLIFAYISIASHLPEKFYSRNFSKALTIAKEKNPDRYCKLFGAPNLSFQVLDNPNIKQTFMDAGCPH